MTQFALPLHSSILWYVARAVAFYGCPSINETGSWIGILVAASTEDYFRHGNDPAFSSSFPGVRALKRQWQSNPRHRFFRFLDPCQSR